MCQVLDNNKTGLIEINLGEISRFRDRYGVTVGRKAYAKIRSKINSCIKRGVEFKITWEMLDLLVDKWVLGEGVCDYTGESFITTKGHDLSPTLERINSSLPYQEGNLCVITMKVNSFKGTMESGGENKITVREEFRELFNQMFTTISNLDKMIEIRNQYIPNKQEKEMTAINNTTINTTTSQTEVPEDIQISKVYYTLMNFFVTQNKKVEITFAQFRRLYKFKNCFLSGSSLTEENKSPILLGDEVTKDTLRFAIRDYATPFQTLIDQQGMTPTLLKNMLSKNLK